MCAPRPLRELFCGLGDYPSGCLLRVVSGLFQYGRVGENCCKNDYDAGYNGYEFHDFFLFTLLLFLFLL